MPLEPPEEKVTSKDVYKKGFDVTPHASNDFAIYAQALTVRTSGDVAVVWSDNTVSVVTMTAGLVYPYMARRVNAIGTTATGITGLY